MRFTDNKERLSVRNERLSEHLEWLDRHRQVVLVPGSLREEPDGAPVGALWIAEAASREELEQLLQSDPFWVYGLRQAYEILHWRKAFPDRRVEV